MHQPVMEILFYKGSLSQTIDTHLARVVETVGKIPQDHLLSLSDEEIFAYVMEDMRINPLVLHEESKALSEQEVDIKYPSLDKNRLVNRQGVRIIVSIPYSGDQFLWSLCPSSNYPSFPVGNLRPPIGDKCGMVDIIFDQPLDEPFEPLKETLGRNLELIKDYIANQQRDILDGNLRLEQRINQAIRNRKENLIKRDSLVKMLNIPLQKNDGVPTIQPIRLEKKVLPPLPPTPRGGEKLEYGITGRDYEYILEVIRHEGRTFETTPETFRSFQENDFRNLLLAHLNGHFKGAATGETFRGNGKTDIRIEYESRAALVAECKIWRGPKEFQDAIGQLLGYLTWRDCKCALIIFNTENTRFSEILQKIPNLVRGHPCFIDETAQQERGEWRFVLASQSDPAMLFILQVIAFDLFL